MQKQIIFLIISVISCSTLMSCSENKTACRQESTAISTDSLLHNQTVIYR